MNKNRVTYLALAACVSAVSCTKETAEPAAFDPADGEIYFKTSLADVISSRAQDMTLESLESFQVSCFNMGDVTKGDDGFVAPYFEDATFIRNEIQKVPTYEASPDEEPREWPYKARQIRFFAFSPSRSVMANGNPAVTDGNRSKYYELINRSTAVNSTVETDYRLGAIRVHPDISRQFDFVTATATGDRWTDFAGGVELAFRHQLSQVEIRAWGASSSHTFEIAGVRLGNPVVEGTFVFSSAAVDAGYGGWDPAGSLVKDKVEYIFRDPGDEHSGEGDRIFNINSKEHNTPATAESIMGLGGCAMVIPTTNQKWEGTANPNNSARRMYFSILMRVTMSASGKQLYPYPDRPDEMAVIHYAVDNTGAVVARVYPGTKRGEFFSDVALQHPYSPAEGVTIKEFGWAAVPIDVDWKAGNRYVYTLNYSDGIGIHDPDDPEPGKPIKEKPNISWGMTVTGWSKAEKNEDFDPDVDVP